MQTEQYISAQMKLQAEMNAQRSASMTELVNKSRYSIAEAQTAEIRTPRVHENQLRLLTEDLEKAKAYRELITRVKEETAREVDQLFEEKAS